MKKLITFFSICITVAILALPAAARNSIAQPDIAAQDPCSQEGKDALYQSFLKNRTADAPKAYEDAKKYLGCPAPAEVTEGQQKIIDYLKKWATAYEKADRLVRFRKFLYVDKKYPEAYALGKEILADEPDNLKVLVDLGANGYLVAPLKNATLSAEAVAHARKALQLLDAGQTIQDWQPLTGKEVALAYINYTIGSLTLESDPAGALKNLLKAAQFETPLKKSPYTYAYIAGAYETGPYLKQSEEYKRVHLNKDETPESKLALANINQIVDRMIDGYARAVALAGTDTNFAAQKPVWNESLTTWYKYLNKKETTEGLDQLVAGILTKPLPPEPTPLTSLPTPAATPAATTTSGTPGTNGTASAATPPAGAPATKPATTPASTTGTKPAPAKPEKPRNRR